MKRCRWDLKRNDIRTGKRLKVLRRNNARTTTALEYLRWFLNTPLHYVSCLGMFASIEPPIDGVFIAAVLVLQVRAINGWVMRGDFGSHVGVENIT